MLLDASSDEEGDKDMGEIKSTFEVRTAKLQKEINKMEEHLSERTIKSPFLEVMGSFCQSRSSSSQRQQDALQLAPGWKDVQI